jgi:hypothetical protein
MTPWNFPHLCTVNSVIPAIISGNAVVLKPAPQTPSPGERVLSAFISAGLPQNVLQVVHLSQEVSLGSFVPDPRIDYVAFTGSVAGGRAVQEAASKGKGFKLVGLELGGKDPAYVREDVDVKWTAEQLLDGAMFNSGQSCTSLLCRTCHQADEKVVQSSEFTSIHPSTTSLSSNLQNWQRSTSLVIHERPILQSDQSSVSLPPLESGNKSRMLVSCLSTIIQTKLISSRRWRSAYCR